MKKKKRICGVKKTTFPKRMDTKRFIPTELKLFLREWKKDKINLDQKERRKKFKKRLLSKEPLSNIILGKKYNDLFEELFLSYLVVADDHVFEEYDNLEQKLNYLQEMEKNEKEGKSFSEEEKIEKKILEEQIDHQIFDICQTLQLFFQEEEEMDKKEQERQIQLQLQLENENNSDEDEVDEFELAYKQRKARQKVFDYITWSLFCFSFVTSLCWMFFWKMRYEEYLIFISVFWISIWIVIGIHKYLVPDSDRTKVREIPHYRYRYIASTLEKIWDLFHQNKDKW